MTCLEQWLSKRSAALYMLCCAPGKAMTQWQGKAWQGKARQ